MQGSPKEGLPPWRQGRLGIQFSNTELLISWVRGGRNGAQHNNVGRCGKCFFLRCPVDIVCSLTLDKDKGRENGSRRHYKENNSANVTINAKGRKATEEGRQ